MKDRVHEVAGAVTGEWAASAIGTVSAGREPEDEDACLWVAKAWNGASPVGLIEVGAAAGLSD